MIIEPMNTPFDGIARLPELGAIRAVGDDAAHFLHGQLTQDFALMGKSDARLAAFCSAKGRMLASFVAIKRDPAEIVLVCSRDLLATALKRLSMFVLRAKVRLTDASDEFAVAGLLGPAVQQVAGHPCAPWTHSQNGEASVVGLYPFGDVARALWIAPVALAAPAVAAVEHGLWCYAEVRSGVATLPAALAEAFVPQMLNYESVGGVNFKKGCYPGQEVVARSQFRGILKRRAFLVDAEVSMAPGDSLFVPADPEQACATVVQAARNPQGGYAALVSGQTSAMQTPVLHLRSADGPAVRTSRVPYPLLEDI